YTTVEFRHYKARKQGNDRETAIESATGIREIQVMYSFNENISPVPYFIRGDGTFSNVYSGKSSKKRYDGAYQGETLEPSNGRTTSDGIVYSLNNTYNLNMGDGEVHYILFDKKFNTAELDILGKENFQVANTLTDTDELEDGVGFDAQIVDITINGITQKAIRLSGGKDYIEYNRVLFNKELFLYVNSEYTNDSSNLSTKTIGLYDNDYIINYEIPVTVYEGLWYQTNHSSTVVGGGEATYKEYYLYRNENFDSLKENESTLFHSIFNPKYITSDPWLDQYHNNNTYTYYFTGDEYDTGNPFNPYSSVFRSILNKCDKVKVYRPAFYYTWEVYLEYRERLDSGGTNTSYLVYGTDEETGEKTKEIIGGYVLSYSMLDGHVVNKTRTQQMRVYEYDPEKIDSFNESDVNLPFGNIYDDNGNIYRWDKGRFTDNLISCLGSNYKNNYLYSSIAYEAEVLDVSKNGRVIESRFNVFGRHHVNSSGNATDPYGVYLRDFNFSAAYNQGSKAYSNWGYYDNTTRDWECFYYENILELPHYNGGGVLHSNDPSKMTTAIPINGIVKQGSYEKYIKSIVPETIYGHTVDRIIYGYSAIGPNKTGPNIFRNAGSNDNNLVYGQYGELYNCGLKIHTYTEYLNGNRTDRDYKILYSKSSAQQKLQWGNTAVKVIVPYYFFNRFPYRYEQSHPNINVANKNIVKISDEGGKPMPSINKNIKITKRGGITIKYKTFDYKNPGDDYSGNILINVTYQVRGCHNMYTGSRTDDSWINYADNSGINEYEGEQKSYFTGENSNTINSYFNNKLEIKKFLE
ncbi:MAG: hypothetical protein FWC24_03655, partial [Treponema sp.]|nr:hypothetical protein [Treponema sp.]